MVRTKKAAAGSNEPPVPPEDVFYTREQAGDAVKEYKKTKGAFMFAVLEPTVLNTRLLQHRESSLQHHIQHAFTCLG